MFLISSVSYWIVLITYVTLVVMLLNNEEKRNLYVDSRIEDFFFNKLDWTVKFVYDDFRNTVYVFLFMFSLVPLLNTIGVLYLGWILAKRD